MMKIATKSTTGILAIGCVISLVIAISYALGHDREAVGPERKAADAKREPKNKLEDQIRQLQEAFTQFEGQQTKTWEKVSEQLDDHDNRINANGSRITEHDRRLKGHRQDIDTEKKNLSQLQNDLKKGIKFGKVHVPSNNPPVSTDLSAHEWVVGVVGFDCVDPGDIDEKGAKKIMYFFAQPRNGVWHIYADFVSHGTNESWNVWWIGVRRDILTD